MAEPVMQGGGAYEQAASMQRAIGDHGVEWVRRSARSVALSDRPVVLVDLGAATGGNSIDPMAAALSELRRRVASSDPLSVIHVDLPSNDFSTLFATVGASDAYGTRDRQVWSSAIGRSFYEQVLPDASVTLAWCATSTHWLRAMPCPLTDTFWMPHATDDERVACAKQADDDWRAFLAARATELVPGGRLVVMALRDPLHAANSYTPSIHRHEEIFRGMVDDGTLRSGEWAAMALPSYPRTTEEHVRPLSEGPLVDLLEIEDFTDLVQPSLGWAAYCEDGDVEAFADATAGLARATMQSVLGGCLDDDRDDDDRARVMDTFFTRLRDSLVADPVPAPGFEVSAIVLRRR